MAMTIPGGPKKGMPLEKAATQDIQYWMKRISGDLERDPDKKYAANDRKWLAEAEQILADRASGKVPESTQAIMKASDSIVGSYLDAREASEKLKEASEHFHLVSPAPSCGSLPEGCELMLSMVRIDPNDPHLYEVGGGKVCPDKSQLLSILNALNGSMEWLQRTDDRSHPHLRAADVCVKYRSFDGQVVRRIGSAEMDARAPDGARYVEIVEQAANAKDKKGNPCPRDPGPQLLQLRKFIWPHTVARALLSAIGNTGIRRSYTRQELEKPFIVAGLIFTGRSKDPQAAKEFRAAIAQSFLGGTAALYGGQPVPAPALPQPYSFAPATGDVDSYVTEAEGETVYDAPDESQHPGQGQLNV